MQTNNTYAAAVTTPDPYVFNRGSIQLTTKLIKKRAPSLALSVQNMLGQAPTLKQGEQRQSRASDCFRCTLDSFQVRAVIENLAGLQKDLSPLSRGNTERRGQMVLARALENDWLCLAQKMIGDLPK